LQKLPDPFVAMHDQAVPSFGLTLSAAVNCRRSAMIKRKEMPAAPLHLAFTMQGNSSPAASLPCAARYHIMEHDNIGQNRAALFELATKLKRFAEESESEGYRGLFMLAAAALDERAFFLPAGDIVEAIQGPILSRPDRKHYH
jgi:hypothetical protein